MALLLTTLRLRYNFTIPFFLVFSLSLLLVQMTNVVAYYQTRLHQFSECLTNFSPLIGKFISIG